MKLVVPGLLFLASAAFAGTQERVDAQLAKGEQALEAVRGVDGAKVLRALEAAKPYFKRARTLAVQALEGAPGAVGFEKAHAHATQRLVGILNAETAIYLDRGARTLAKKRNGEALRLLPADARAKALEEAIANPAPYEFEARLVDLLVGGVPVRPIGRAGAVRRNLGRQ